MCDVPLISQGGEKCEMTQLWHQGFRATDESDNTSVVVTKTTSWGMYPIEQARLLYMIFRKLQKDPKFHVVFICSGAYASRTTISDNLTKLSFQQIVLGPISRPGLSKWLNENVSTFGDGELAIRYSIQHEIPVGSKKSQQCCVLELVPHPFGASSDIKFYMQHQDEARLILGPIIGRVTPRTARILIELDRLVPNLGCTLIDSATSQR
ncbi:hypothetical protein PHPALM_3572 [Phytophthora palmivora]|uniref:Uncharacterized protein n=1 Tax=Phytophthora palmivora TaxID=4796 RepID=A0A2P4YM18_9STRA|nr:hypothetical protein PHPALM_3572 [Phytophthora palmivora]